MDNLDEWFPYDSYRPHQKDMLSLAAECAKTGGIAMIDAPTGSGKSSVVSALLAEANGRKIIVAVRTVSQLNTFIRELELVRKKKRGLKVAYLVGKRKMCPMSGIGDTYRLCEGLKAFSSSLLRERAQKGALIPARDTFIREQIRMQDPEHPLICPYFIRSRVFTEGGDGLKMIPSSVLRAKSEQALKRLVSPEKLYEFSDEICPYEIMMHAARDADVILVNFHHLFNENIREQMYQSLGIEAENTLLLIDEAHNCGDTVQSIQSIVLSEQNLEQVQNELGNLRNRIKGVEAIMNVVPQVRRFMDSLKRSFKTEDWFDPHMFMKYILNGSLYTKPEEIVDDLLRIDEALREHKLEKGDYRESAVERLTEFFYRMFLSLKDNAYLSIYRKDELGMSLEVRNIDPSSTLREITGSHGACVLISGSLSPIDSYRRFYFEDMPVKTLSLPNSFPEKNRLVCCAGDITSAYSRRRDADNTQRIKEYIREFAEVKGNLAVYFPSYDLMNTYTADLSSKLNGKEVFIESQVSAESNNALKRFLSLPGMGKSGILFGVCGGKWSEGLDYRGDLLNGAFVIGFPLAPFNDVRKMVIDYFKKKFGAEGEFISYTLPAINKAVQALGRVIRTPKDHGILLLGDTRFTEKRVWEGLPPWMQAEMKECNITTFKRSVRKWR